MIAGIGTDLCDVKRIEAALSRNGDRFVQRILGDRERQIFAERRQAHEERGIRYLATRFAAKEAFAKAIGLGIRHPMNWHDCQVASDEHGRPHFQLSGELADWFANRSWSAHLSLSDEGDHALAFVVIEHLPPAA